MFALASPPTAAFALGLPLGLACVTERGFGALPERVDMVECCKKLELHVFNQNLEGVFRARGCVAEGTMSEESSYELASKAATSTQSQGDFHTPLDTAFCPMVMDLVEMT